MVMLRSKWSIALILLTVLALCGWKGQETTKLDDAGLKTMLSGLGYEVKEPGTTTYEIPLTSDGLNIPTRVFLAKSKTKVWLSVALMTKDGVAKLTRDDLQKILEKNVDIGPCHFMIDGGFLKMKLPIDNRDITPAILRSELDYLAARVADSKDLWLKK